MITVLLICEDRGHRDFACTLIDRCIQRARPKASLNDVRTWSDAGGHAADGFLKKKDIGSVLKSFPRIRSTKLPFKTASGETEKAANGAIEWRNALNLVRALNGVGHRIDHVVLMCDEDNEADRHKGLLQATREHKGLFGPLVTIGFPQLEVEAWVLSGFVPANKREQGRLDALRNELSRDPVTRSHELRDNKDHEPRSPKRVLAELTEGDEARRRACYEETRLDVLKQNGADNGLANFIARIETTIVPTLR